MYKILISISCIGIALASFFLYSYPTYTEAQGLSEKITTLGGSLKTAEELLGLRDQLLVQYRSLPPEDVKKLSTAIPDNARNINFVIDMESVLARHNLTLSAAKVEPPKVDSTKGKVGSNTSSLENAAKGYNGLDISMSVTGTLSDFTLFMADLEQNLRLTTISSVSFKATKPKGQASANGAESDLIEPNERFTFDLSLIIYWLKK